MAAKLANLHDARPVGFHDPEAKWLKAQLAELDRALVREELARIAREKGYKIDGNSDTAALGADAWILA